MTELVFIKNVSKSKALSLSKTMLLRYNHTYVMNVFRMSNINIVWNWTQFCEQDDDLIIWDPRHNDFGRCFEVVCLQFPLLALLAITSAYYCGKQMDWVVRTSFESNVLKIRYLTCLLLSMVSNVSCTHS